jgi:hypothetical protein
LLVEKALPPSPSSWMRTLTMSIGWMTLVANMPARPPARRERRRHVSCNARARGRAAPETRRMVRSDA